MATPESLFPTIPQTSPKCVTPKWLAFSVKPPEHQLLQAKILVERLARLSADSVWARRASGLRASLDKFLGDFEAGQSGDMERLDLLIRLGFEMLEKAAEEIPVPEEILLKVRKNS